MTPPVEIVERHTEVDGLETHWRQAGDAPILYLHGVPTAWLAVGAVPRAHRRSGARPARLRPLRQARRLRLLDPRLRPLPRGVLRPRRPRAVHARDARLGLGGARASPSASPSASSGWCCSPSFRWCPATAGTGWRARGERPCWASSRWASPPAGACGARCRARSPTAPTTSSTRAPSARSCACTARRRPRCWPGHGERLGELRCPALIQWPTRRSVHRRGVRPALRRRARRRDRARVDRRPGTNWLERPELVRPRGRLSQLASRPVLRAAVTAPPRTRPPQAPSTSPAGGAARGRAALVLARRLVARRAGRDRRRVRHRLPDLAAAHGRPGRPHLPRRPVRRGGLHDLERAVVRRPPHAGLLDHLAAAGLAALAGAGARAGRGRLAPRCSARSPAAPSARRPRAGARSGSASAAATLLFTARLPFAIGVAFGLAALLALQRRRYAWAIVFALCRRSAARWPGSSSRWPAWRLRARGKRGPHASGSRACWSPPPRSSRRCSCPGPSRRAAGRRSRSPPTCPSRSS